MISIYEIAIEHLPKEIKDLKNQLNLYSHNNPICQMDDLMVKKKVEYGG